MAVRLFKGLRRAMAKSPAADAPDRIAPLPHHAEISADLARAQVLLATAEFSSDDPMAQRLANAVLNGQIADESQPFITDRHHCLPLAALGYALAETGRLASLDWRATPDEGFAAFSAIFEKAGLIWPVHIEEQVNDWIADPALDVSQSIALVYYALRTETRAVGFELLLLSDGSDTYHFFLVSRAVADRWRNVHLGDMMWIESPDWDFRATLKKNNWDILYPEHASDHPATPPQP